MYRVFLGVGYDPLCCVGEKVAQIWQTCTDNINDSQTGRRLTSP